MITVVKLQPDAHPNLIGFIPEYLDDADPRSAKEQLHQNYAHSGGWVPMDGFTMTEFKVLQYPEDSDLYPVAMIPLRREFVLIYPLGIIAILQPDGSFEVARMD